MALRPERDPRPGVAALRAGDPALGRRRHLPPGDRPRPRHGRVGIGLRLLPVLAGRGADLRARRGDRALQDLLGRHAADRVGGPGRPVGARRVGLAAVARGAPRGRLLREVGVGPRPRRPRPRHGGGQRRMALRPERDPRPGVAARKEIRKVSGKATL